MAESIPASKGSGIPAMEEAYFIRSLSAPMRLSATGEICSRLNITQGTTLTIGRSRKGCDVVFEDSRVSRKHCQLRLLRHSYSLVLLDGATASNAAEFHLGNHFSGNLRKEHKRLRFSPQAGAGALEDESHSIQSASLPQGSMDLQSAIKLKRKTKSSRNSKEKHSSMESPPSRATRHRSAKEAPGPWMPSLNGIFVNGRESRASMIILMPGDEVSLVGPTVGGKSLDSDCLAVVGFVVEAGPMVEKVQPTTVEHTVCDNFSAPDMGCIAHDLGDGNCCKRVALDDMQDNQSDSCSPKSLHHNQVMDVVDAPRQALIAKPIDYIQCIEFDTQARLSSTRCSIEPRSVDPCQGRNPCAATLLNVQAASSPVDLDHKLLSTFNLVRASIRLRYDLLNCYTAGSSHDVVGQKDLLFSTTERRVESSKEILDHSLPYTDFMMPIINKAIESCGRPIERQLGNSVHEKDVSFCLEHTVKVDSIPVPQVIIPEYSFQKNLESHCSSLEGPSLGNDSLNDVSSANPSQFARTLLVHSNSHTVTAPASLYENLDVVLCKRKNVDCLASSAENGDPVEGPVSGNFLKDFISQKPLPEEFKDKTAEKAETFYEYSCAKDACQMRVEAATASTIVAQVNEELNEGQARPQQMVHAVQSSDGGCNIEAPRGRQPSMIESGISLDGKQLENGQVPKYTTGGNSVSRDANCHLRLTDAATSECRIIGESFMFCRGNSTTVNGVLKSKAKVKSVNGNVNCSDLQGMQRKRNCTLQDLEPQEVVCSRQVQQHVQATSTLCSSTTDIEVISVERVPGNADGPDMEDVRKQGTCALQELGHQKTICSVKVKQHQPSGLPRLDLPAVGACYSGLQREDLFGEDALEDTFQGKITVVESSFLEAALNKNQVFSSFQPDGGMTSVAHKELDCDDARSHDAAIQGVDENVCKHDQHYCQSLAINTQLDEVVDIIVSNLQTNGYCLNQLEDVTSGVPNQDNVVRFWDLLALTDDVQALFIATFTYDMEWFLSSAGLSRDIPVTVACHSGKHCWSKSSKDRCEKPYSDWPNVTLVYPPFPRSHAFSSKGRGIGCHHPKIFLVRRTRSLRVIVSSANLTHKQWFHVTNNVWWQDFSCRQSLDFRCLFRGEETINSTASSDFGSQLAMFLAALLVGSPSEAHWVIDLAAFDFSDAVGSLVASVPGLHQPLYQNAPQFLMTLDKEQYYPSRQGDVFASSYLGVVPTTVAGIKYRFCPSADRNGTRIRCLAAALNDNTAFEGSTMPVLLKRAKFLKADPNAVSVVVTSRAKSCSQDLFLQQDLQDAGSFLWACAWLHMMLLSTAVADIELGMTEIDTMETDAFDTEEGFIKLGFLPRDVASWLAVLCDRGFFSFAACIWPIEALDVASGHRDGAAKLALYVFQGPKFSTLSSIALTREECGAFAGLLRSLHTTWGLWRLEKILCRYNWADSCESDFYVASSSIGTSLDAKFLAAFAAAAGRKAESLTLSQESDPQWGCWTAEQEAINPSIGIVFPTIDRVRQDNFLHYGLLCFAESAWLRLKAARLLHDAVPYPPEREHFPMHIKVARRRFQDPLTSQSYGWMYCGSHNFSPAAWGRPIWRATDWEAATDAGSVLGSSLHICNYELGVVLIEPPPNECSSMAKKELDRGGLDRFVLPFKVPPPMYRNEDRPATGRAMMEAYLEMRALQQLEAAEEDVAVMESEVEAGPVQQEHEEAACDAESRAEQVYIEALWTQMDDEDHQKDNHGGRK